MKYNKNVEKILNDFINDDARIITDKFSRKYIYDNQIKAAKEIIKSFTAHLDYQDEHEARNNHVVLVAKMQSGKTGTCNAVINILEKTKLSIYFNIDKYFYITGMNDNGLHNQTVNRIISDEDGQVIGASIDNVCNGIKDIPLKPHAKFYVQKNSDLRKNNITLKNCLIFIDESHFGSNKFNVLTKFLEENGINWKNNDVLKNKHIYIVSVSATPFDEIVSDIADCKTIVELETEANYIGVSEYLQGGCIFNANKSDFILNKNTGEIPIIKYIKDTYIKIKNNDNRGILFIRTRNKKIKNNEFIRKHFKIIELDASKRGAIDYESVATMIEAMIYTPSGSEYNKPIIFFVKGAYRAGITLKPKHKDYVYLVYDYSDKPETTAQGLLGRMCGYRNNNSEYLKTVFYINRQHAEEYAEWEENFKIKGNIPSSKTWEWVDDKINDNKINDSEIKISTKCNKNFTLKLSDNEIKRFILASINKNINNKDFCRNELRMLCPNFIFDYIGETYISGKNTFSESVIRKWFDSFSEYNYCPSYRVDSYFKQLNDGRGELSEKDVGKIICHVVLDADIYFDKNRNISKIKGNKRLLIYNGTLSKKVKIKNLNKLIKPHKKTL